MARSAWLMTAGLAAALGSLAGPASAETATSCAPRAMILQHLAQQEQEQPVAVGVADNGMRLEVLANAGGNWTLLVSLPNGMACLMNAGTDWQAVPKIATITAQTEE